jgi:hypothetical protein
MRDACDVCGNTYDTMMTVFVHEKKHRFDCLECAIQALAPSCSHCGVRILGHGLQDGERMFCCAHCARSSGQTHFVDRVSQVRL